MVSSVHLQQRDEVLPGVVELEASEEEKAVSRHKGNLEKKYSHQFTIDPESLADPAMVAHLRC